MIRIQQVISGLIFVCLAAGCGSTRPLVTVWSIGDSTMADKKPQVNPETGWGQVFYLFLKGKAQMKNRAVNGRSSKSFLSEGRWQNVLDSLQKDDYVLIQFGHNDQKSKDSTRYSEPHTTYRKNLERFVRETREKGATPVLFTSIIRRKFDEQGKLVDTHGEYPGVVRQVAREMQVYLVDLHTMTAGFMETAGPDESKKYFLWTPPDLQYPEGRKDDTHLNRDGAMLIAGMAANAMKRLGIPVVRKKK